MLLLHVSVCGVLSCDGLLHRGLVHWTLQMARRIEREGERERHWMSLCGRNAPRYMAPYLLRYLNGHVGFLGTFDSSSRRWQAAIVTGFAVVYPGRIRGFLLPALVPANKAMSNCSRLDRGD